MFNEPLYNGSRDLYYNFAIIATLLSRSDGIPLSFCQQIYFVCCRSVTCTWISCWKGVGQEDSNWPGWFFFSFLRWPSWPCTIEGKTEGVDFSVRLPLLNSATCTTSTHNHVWPLIAAQARHTRRREMTGGLSPHRFVHPRQSTPEALSYCNLLPGSAYLWKGKRLAAANITYRRIGVDSKSTWRSTILQRGKQLQNAGSCNIYL